ncbi:MAG: YdcF family protein [Clostridiales Family XIII bacterium]|jgi:uncharacterized SAM-binding protein YcdF (DUF218 family)|nr:YdcF family protein [Clostridiales Family XIII bacterium]
MFDIALFSFGLLCAGLFIYHVMKEPRRILCALLLSAALYCIIRGGLALLRPSQVLPNGDLLVGDGDEIFMWIGILFCGLSFWIGIALCINGGRVIAKEGLSLAHALPLFFGIISISWPLLSIARVFFLVVFSTSSLLIVISLILWNIALYVPGMLIAILLYSIVYARLPKPKDCDFILVLGAGLVDGTTVTPLLAKRLDRAIRLYETNGKNADFIVSGGKGADEKVSEAYAMRQYLLEQNIPEEKIIMEECSKNTLENLRFSKHIMEERNANYQALIVTSNYHVLRTVILAKNIAMNAQGIGCKTAFYYLPAAFIREYIAVIFAYKYLALIYVLGVLLFTLI